MQVNEKETDLSKALQLAGSEPAGVRWRASLASRGSLPYTVYLLIRYSQAGLKSVSHPQTPPFGASLFELSQIAFD